MKQPRILPIVLWAGETQTHHIRTWAEIGLKNLRDLGASTVVTMAIEAPINSGDDAWLTPGGTVRSATAGVLTSINTFAVQITSPTTAGMAYVVIRTDGLTRYDARVHVRRRV